METFIWMWVLAGVSLVFLICLVLFVAEVVRCRRKDAQWGDEYKTITLPLKSSQRRSV